MCNAAVTLIREIPYYICILLCFSNNKYFLFKNIICENTNEIDKPTRLFIIFIKRNDHKLSQLDFEKTQYRYTRIKHRYLHRVYEHTVTLYSKFSKNLSRNKNKHRNSKRNPCKKVS